MAETTTRDKLLDYAKRSLRDHNGQITRLRISELTMEFPSLSLLETIVADIRSDMPKKAEFTKVNKFDCDDYSFIFKGLVGQWYRRNRPNELPFAIGVAWGHFHRFSPGEFHSLNFIFLADDRKLQWIEPQFIRESSLTDAMVKFSASRDTVSLLML